jgi:hypothetical protein
MKLKYLLWALPLLSIAEVYAFSRITYLLRQASDAAVLAGAMAICLLIGFNFYLVFHIVFKIKRS